MDSELIYKFALLSVFGTDLYLLITEYKSTPILINALVNLVALILIVYSKGF